jgi:hypothetical protein
MLAILTAGYYLVAFDPRLGPFRSQNQVDLGIKHPNPVDREFLEVVRSVPKALCASITKRFPTMLCLPILLPQNALDNVQRANL